MYLKRAKKISAIVLSISLVSGVFPLSTSVNKAGVYAAGDGIITTVTRSNEGDVATNISQNPVGVALTNQYVYVSDHDNNVIRRIDRISRKEVIIAGTGEGGFSGDGGNALNAKLNHPYGIAVDSTGNLYIADTDNHCVRKINQTSNVITTVAGTGEEGESDDNVPANMTTMQEPYGVTVDGSNNLYIADRFGCSILKVTRSSGILNIIGGTGISGNPKDGQLATNSEFGSPCGVAVDISGNVYVADVRNNKVVRINSSDKKIKTVASIGEEWDDALAVQNRYWPCGVAVDNSGNVYIEDIINSRIKKVNPSNNSMSIIAGTGGAGFSGEGSPASSAKLNKPCGIALDSNGSLFVADSRNYRVREIAANGYINTYAGNGQSSLNYIAGVAVDAKGNIYAADSDNNCIRRVNASDNSMTTIAGTGEAGFSGDGGAAAACSLNKPLGVAVDRECNLYVADEMNNRIRKINLSDNTITTIAGTGMAGYSGDGGAAAFASLNKPSGVAVDGYGNIYVADSDNNCIRKISKVDGTISTIAGTGFAGYMGDGGPALNAQMNKPCDVKTDSECNIYIADTRNNRIRKIDSSNSTITTIAGNGTDGYTGDGVPAASASIGSPCGVSVDRSRNIYIADTLNNRIRKISAADGTICTIAGTGEKGYSGEGMVATTAKLNMPFSVSVYADRLYISGYKYLQKVSISPGGYTERMTISSDGDITEGSENGKIIKVNITGGRFAQTLNPQNWTISNLPDGVMIDNINRTSDTTAEIKLKGKRITNFENNINLKATCQGSEYFDSYDGETLTSQNTVTLHPMSDQASVDDDYNLLGIGYASGDSAASVTRNMVFAAKGQNGCDILWSSDHSSIVNSIGSVNRPSNTEEDVKVKVTAVICKNGISKTKTFDIVVKKKTSAEGNDLKNDTNDDTNNGNPGDSSGVNDDNQSSENTSNDIVVTINGVRLKGVVKAVTTNKDGRKSATITLDTRQIESAVSSKTGKKVIDIVVNGDLDESVLELDGQFVKDIEKKNVVVQLTTKNASYLLPLEKVKISDVSAKLGKNLSLKDTRIAIRISNVSGELLDRLKNKANAGKYSIISPAAAFNVTCTGNGKTMELDSFGGYIERLLPIKGKVDKEAIITGVFVNKDGSVSHAPTKRRTINGINYASIKGFIHGTYCVISNRKEFKDVKNLWSKQYVNEMGSRLIMSGSVSNEAFPLKNISRAEFSAIMVRALGLGTAEKTYSFKDIKKTDWYYGAVCTAYEYGLINGYGDRSFDPNKSITREEAMGILSRAMKLAEMNTNMSDKEASALCAQYKDNGKFDSWAKKSAAVCVKYGIVLGNKGMINPKDNITRGEIAAIIIRMLQKADLI